MQLGTAALTFLDKFSQIQLRLDLLLVGEVSVASKHAAQLAQEVVFRIRIVSS